MSNAKPRRERKPMPPGREALPRKERKPMPAGREALPRKERKPMPAGGEVLRRREPKPMPPGREAQASGAPGQRAEVDFAVASAGGRIVAASWWGTVLLVVTSAAGAIDPHPLDVPALVVALVLFFGGIVAFFGAYVIAIGRSRESEIGIAAVFGLAGCAPRSVQVRLYASLAVTLAASVSTAAARLHSVLAFGILANMWPLGMMGLWGARYGAFPPRKPTPQRRRRRG